MPSLCDRVTALENAGDDGPNIKVSYAEFCMPVGWVNVDADGTIAAQCGDVTVTRTATGTYNVTPPPLAQTIKVDVVESIGTRDSIEIHPTDFVGTTVHISEGDNGTAANILRDRPWTAVWYGPPVTLVTEVTIT